MRRMMTSATLVGLVALVVVTVGMAQPAAQEGRRRWGGRQGMMGGGFMGQGGRLQTGPEARELWERLGELQNRLRDRQWELFELMNAEPRAAEAIEATQAEIREINERMQQVRQQMAQYWVQQPGMGQAAGERAQGLQAFRAFRERLGQGMGAPGMGAPSMMGVPGMGLGPMGQMGPMAPPPPPTIVIDQGKLYLVMGGQLYKYDTDTLELEKTVPIPLSPPGPPVRPMGVPGAFRVAPPPPPQ